MPKTIHLAIIFGFIFCGNVFADKVGSMEEARELSRQSGKPILLEFIHED